jgi:hypothetical protein
MQSQEQYLKKLKSDTNLNENKDTLYYPGSGTDFGPLCLFVENYNISNVIYTDYCITCKEITSAIKENLSDYQIGNIEEIKPGYFNLNRWEEFWPDNAESKKFGKPENAYGFKVELNKKGKKIKFIFLGVDGFKAYEIISKCGYKITVVVLQDHGFGCNWSNFGGKSELYEIARKHELPDMLFIGDETKPWPNYNQASEYSLIEKGQQHNNLRAIYSLK